MYYGAKISEELRDKIKNLMTSSTLIGNIFDNNIVNFVRSAIRFQVIAYYLRSDIDMSLVSIYSETTNITLKIQKVIVKEIVSLFEEIPEIKVKYSNSKNKFINYSIVYHLVYWIDILDQLSSRSS